MNLYEETIRSLVQYMVDKDIDVLPKEIIEYLRYLRKEEQ